MEDIRKQEKEEGMFKREELPERFIARKLFGQLDKRYDEEYWARLERNWRRWKGGRTREQRTMEIIKEEEKESKQGGSGLRKQTEEDDDEMGNICDLYYEL